MAIWAQEIAGAINHADRVLAKMITEGAEASPEYVSFYNLAMKFKSALRLVWKEDVPDVFNVG